MSMLCCDDCGNLIDSDDDPEGFYVKSRPDKFICEHCRENYPEEDREP